MSLKQGFTAVVIRNPKQWQGEGCRTVSDWAGKRDQPGSGQFAQITSERIACQESDRLRDKLDAWSNMGGRDDVLLV